MKLFLSTILAILFLAISREGFAQDFSNRGKEFWVAYGHHQFMEPGESPANGQNMVIYLSAEQAAVVTITVDSSANMFGPDWTRTYVVPANTVISTGTATPIAGFPTPLTPGPIPKAGLYDFRLFSLPCSFVPAGTPCGSEQIFRGKGIHITSDVPIVAYAHIYGSVASGATMLVPVESWGYTYTSINSNQTNASNSFSWMYVIAKHDSTVLRITPSVTTRLLKPANVPFDITLNKGQIYQLVGQTMGSNGLELTGTTVKSIANSAGKCYPVAVFAGSSRTGGWCNNGSGSRDNDMQQAFPQQAWGKRYLTAPLSQSGSISSYSKSPYKIIVKDPTTVVRRNGGPPLTGLTNNFYRFESNEAELIEADKPIMVAQFMAASGSCLSGLGDPEMMYISPIEQAIKRVGFYRTTLESISINYLTLIIPTNGLNSLTIEGIPWASIPAGSKYTYLHPKIAGYSIAIRRWSAAQSQVIVQSDSAFNGLTYGLGGAESYGYNAGTFLKNLNAAGSILNTNDTTGSTSSEFTCTNSPVKLSVLLAYETPPTKLEWHLSQVGGGLSPNTDVIDASPTPVGTQAINGITYTKYDLPGTYQFSSVGIWRIPITATHPSIENCTNSEELYYEVEVKGKPIADFAIANTGCVLDTVKFTGETTSANGFAINQWLYTFPDATTSIAKDTSKRFLVAGTYNVKLRIVSAEGCVGDTIKPVSVSAAPITNFTTVPAAVCKDAPVTFNDNSTYTGVGNINNSWWDFGDGTFLAATNADPVTHTYTTYGSFTVRHTAGLGASCLGDTITKVVTVFAPPTTSFTYPAGCLPASGTVQFTSTATSDDGQVITGHLWNFGDPASGAANTSIQANPTHTYPGFGNYTITYQVTTANGCVKDTTVSATMNLAPTFNYPALAPVCENAAGAVNVATATVTNSVPGSGEYHGPATTLAGSFNPATAGAGTFTIWYVYVTTGNCIDSVSQTITVNPTPDPSFSIPAAGCLSATGLVAFTYTGTALPGQTYLWNFGDPASGAANTSTLANPSHNFTTGSYTISLKVTSANGCIKDSVVTQQFNISPSLTWATLAPVCQNAAAPINIATATVTNGATGTGIYNGPGTTTAGIFNPAIAGAGTHTIWYVFTATGNCKDSISRTIEVYPTPDASFSIPAAGCLPTSGAVTFTYSGSALPGQTYLWNFGDPASGAANNSTLSNPTHNYIAGSYTISLKVTSTNGCVKDSVVSQQFNVTPALAWTALTPVCQNAAAPINIATATVTNGATGTGIYNGPGTTTAGIFDPAIAGAGTHTIWYVFTATGNCKDSISRTIEVYPTPDASFSIPASGCLPANGLVNISYTGTALPGQTYLWNFGDPASGASNTSTVANPSHNFTTGSYTISLKVTSTNGCVKDSIITQQFNITPALAYPALSAVCQNASAPVNIATATVTNGATGTGVYSGPGTTAAGIFDPSAAGAGTHTITYTFTGSGNCVSTITQTIVVNPTPDASFSIPAAGCLPANGLVNFTYTGTALPGQTYLWNFGDPASGAANTSTIANPSHNFTTGSYTISLKVTSTNGCVKDSIVMQQFNITPALNYPALTPVCESVTGTVNVAMATITNGATGTGVYSGPGVSANGTFNPSVAGPGTHTITYTFTGTGNCVSTITQTILVYAKPHASFTYPTAACLPVSGLAQFNYNGTVTAGQTYAWNFDDAASGSANNSTLQNPTHTYKNTGNYAVRVTVTNANGCIDDTVINITFSVTPALAFPALTAICESVVGTINIATATVTNGVTGTGVYSGPGTSANGSFNPSVAGPGTHTITYTFTSAGNCVSTITQTIQVNPKPVNSFTITPGVCLGQQATITDNSNTSAGTITSWNWNFGDGNTSTFANGNPFTYTYSTYGTYTVKLVTMGSNGCVGDTVSHTITVSPVPVASFTLPTSVCMPNGTATFINNSTDGTGSGGSGTLSYNWNFGDGSSPATTSNGNHVYAGISSYPVTLTATSAAGCVDDTTMIFSAFFDKPVALFTVSPDSLCQGTDNVFTDNSTAPNSTIKTQLWIFGDGSTSAAVNPIKRYNSPGLYTVKLVVTNIENCVSDTFSKQVRVYLQPTVDAGPSFIVPQGSVIRFNPSTNDSTSVLFNWSPPFGLSDPTVLRPVLTATSDQVYTLTATGEGNCSASDILTVKILRAVIIPNAFSPNGDGTNDTWIIENLADYANAVVEVYNRYGQMVYTSIGYGVPWDGTTKGKPLPVATYYYVIQLKNGFKPMTGSVTIIR